MLGAGLLVSGCASIAQPRPRFIAVYEQQSDFCHIQVVKDTRTAACFIAFRCGRHPVSVLAVDHSMCVP